MNTRELIVIALVLVGGCILLVGGAWMLDRLDAKRKQSLIRKAQAEAAWRTIGAANRITTAFMHAQEAMRQEARKQAEHYGSDRWPL